LPWVFAALFVLTVAAVLLYQLSYRYRKRRNKVINRENKQFEEIKDNIEFIKTAGAEEKEIRQNKKSFRNDAKSIFPIALSKSLYGTIPNYILLEYMPVVLLLFLADNGKF